MEINLTSLDRKHNYIKGKIENTNLRFQARVYENNSDLGINGGKVSRLLITNGGAYVANYDKGWDIVPKPKYEKVFHELLNYLENTQIIF